MLSQRSLALRERFFLQGKNPGVKDVWLFEGAIWGLGTGERFLKIPVDGGV
jgi:hypothetical protein